MLFKKLAESTERISGYDSPGSTRVVQLTEKGEQGLRWLARKSEMDGTFPTTEHKLDGLRRTGDSLFEKVDRAAIRAGCREIRVDMAGGKIVDRVQMSANRTLGSSWQGSVTHGDSERTRSR